MFEEQLAHLPVEPPRAPTLLPGLKLSASLRRSALLVPALFVLLFATFPLMILRSDPTTRLALGPSRTAQGQVLSASDAPAAQRAGTRRVVYEFSPESGRQVRGACVLSSESPYYEVRPGDAISIRYLASDPVVSAVAVSTNNEPPVFVFLFFPLIALLIFMPMFWPQLKAVLRARRLFKRGQIAAGKVVFVKRSAMAGWPGWPGGMTADVYVQYQRRGGGRVERRAPVANDWLVNQLAPGSPVHIAYLDSEPERIALLEAYIR